MVAEMKAEADAALEDYRSEYLQQEYGKDVLKSLMDEAKKEYKKVVDELGILKSGDKGRITGKGLKLKIRNLEQSIENASPNKKECLEEFSLVRAQKLQVPDLEADAAVLTGILEIAYAKVRERKTREGRACLSKLVSNTTPLVAGARGLLCGRVRGSRVLDSRSVRPDAGAEEKGEDGVQEAER